GNDYGTSPSYPTYAPSYSGSPADVMPGAAPGQPADTPPAGGYQYQSYYPPATSAGSYQYQSYYPPPAPAAPPPDRSAYVTVTVPADARVWFQGAATTSTGSVRHFHSPPLASGSQYTYNVKATWTENGHDVTQTQQVGVTPGARASVTF